MNWSNVSFSLCVCVYLFIYFFFLVGGAQYLLPQNNWSIKNLHRGKQNKKKYSRKKYLEFWLEIIVHFSQTVNRIFRSAFLHWLPKHNCNTDCVAEEIAFSLRTYPHGTARININSLPAVFLLQKHPLNRLVTCKC